MRNDLSRILSDESTTLSRTLRNLIGNLLAELRMWNEKFKQIEDNLKLMAKADPNCTRLLKIPGVGFHKKMQNTLQSVAQEFLAPGLVQKSFQCHADRGHPVSANSFRNEYDGDTLQGVLNQIAAVSGRSPKKAFCDRGFRGWVSEGCTSIIISQTPSSEKTEHMKRKARRDFGRRSAIEGVFPLPE